MPKAKGKVSYFSEEINFVLKGKRQSTEWIIKTIESEGLEQGEINYIFCSDAYLLTLNQKYLNHDTLTDILTFGNTERAGLVGGDIFISIERVKENAALYKATFSSELSRVMIHGILHLCGYKDKSPEEAQNMRKKENHYLSLK